MADEAKDTDVSTTESLRTSRAIYTKPTGEIAKRNWGFHNEPISSYEKSFKNVLEGKKITDIIIKLDPIVIDIMAPPRAVYDLLTTFPKGRGLAVSLPDHNPLSMRDDIVAMYKAINVTWLPKDITKPQTWNEIEKWLNGEKADLIMERAMAGLYRLPTNKKFYGILLNQAWKNLNTNGGTLLFETLPPDELMEDGIDLGRWVDNLRKVVDVKYDPGEENNDNRIEGAKLKITKTPQSPANLPTV